MKAVLTPADKDKNLDAALAAFKDMENSADVQGFKGMAMYHQARVLMAKGDNAKAKEILLSLKERLEKPEDPIAAGLPAAPAYPYLKELAMDRLRDIDPAAAPKLKDAPDGWSARRWRSDEPGADQEAHGSSSRRVRSSGLSRRRARNRRRRGIAFGLRPR